jgi:hypothetical protein
VYGFVERSIAIAHERSPLETTHDDLRLAVEPASGGCDRPGVVPCPLTIYAARARVVRVGGSIILTETRPMVGAVGYDRGFP